MNLGLIYHSTFRFEEARRAYDEAFAHWQTGDTSDAAAQAGGEPTAVFRFPLHAPQTLDPSRGADGVSEIYINQLFSGLVELNTRGEILPNVAQSWQVLDGGRRYIFQLRPDVFWSDGRPVTASDFIFSWLRALDPANGPNPANLLYDIKGARAFNEGQITDPGAVGLSAAGPSATGLSAAGLSAAGLSAAATTSESRTLLVELEGPAAYFLQLLTRGVAMPVPAHAVRQYGDDWTDPAHIVTNGPFRPSSWDERQEIILTHYPRYHGRRAGNTGRVQLLTDPELPLLASYESGQIDVLSLNALEATESDLARLSYPGQYISLPFLHTSYFAFDVTRPPFDDQRLRRAFALATDKTALADEVLGGKYAPALGGLLPPGMPGSAPAGSQPLSGPAFDPDQARGLLAEAGYPAGQGFPRLPILVVRRPLMTAIRRHLSASWSQILGVEFDWDELFFANYLERLAADKSPIWFSGWAADYPDPDNFMRVSNWRHISGWRHDDYEQLVSQAPRVAGENQRLAMYHQAETILANETPIVPLFYSRHHLLLQPHIKKYPIAPLGTLAMKDIQIKP
jgi:ABC-type oligopeptide transport system substrate-binding subunit